MFKEFKYYEKLWKNSKKRKNFEMEFKNWSQEDKRHFLESGFQIQFEDWIKIVKIKLYLYKDTIRIGVYTGRHISNFMLFMAKENDFHPMNYTDGKYHMDYEILLKSPLI